MVNSVNLFLFEVINSLAGQFSLVDYLMILVAKFFILIPLVYLLFRWFKGDDKIVLFAVLSLLLSLLINQVISFYYYHPRPFIINAGSVIINHSPDSSFPSDHTTFALSIAFSLILSKKRSGSLLFLNGLLVGFARIFVGVHFPFDIIGSIITSFIGSFIVHKYFKGLVVRLSVFSNSFKVSVNHYLFKGR